VVNSQFWRNKRVFLTGHTGFKGSWMSLWLQSLGAELTGYSLQPPTSPSLFEVAGVADGMVSILGDVRDFDALLNAIRQAKPEIVIHMAAQPLVRYSYANPVETYATNVMGVVHLLESIRQVQGVRAVVNVTTDKCYENKEWLWSYRENESMGGYDPYSNSKGCAELVTSAFRNSYFNPETYQQHGVALGSARAGNVIGGGDWALDRLVPDIMRAIIDGKRVNIRSPHAIRPWQHVLEPLAGYLALAEKLFVDGAAFAEGWNFGPRETDARPVQWIVEQLTKKWSDQASWELDKNPQPHEASYLKLDISKAVARLDWAPGMSLEEALGLIVSWNRAFVAGEKMKQVTLDQISNYQNVVNAVNT
jgi:CDP-glucose 4,6-dehydratase